MIPESVTYLANQTFSGCTALKEVSLPDTMTTIRLWVFDGCTSLETIKTPGSIEYFGVGYMSNIPQMMKGDPFRGCSALKSISMPQKAFDAIEKRAIFEPGRAMDEEAQKLIVII